MGQHSYQGLSALDQILAQMGSQDELERSVAFLYARAYLNQLVTNEPDAQIKLVFQALQLLAEKDLQDESPRLPPSSQGRD